MIRRNFIKTISAASVLGAAFPFQKFLQKTFQSRTFEPAEIIKPKRIKKGDTIGLIAPASNIHEDELKESITNLEGLGFKVVYTDSVLARSGYLGGTDKQRADDTNKMFARKDVDAIVCVRGGYGCARILTCA